ncbi:hypothetical protein AVEN_173093-1 [Araneus ventricosus]|uniref:Uncharacterized protein n=1 Tax=Araneus ventricosus TaxID=182803 RepID=A0A4Y2HRQ9_ARAVE|nr:hypothetical protein AVEN_173093-1 [Araneus ventricosus]
MENLALTSVSSSLFPELLQNLKTVSPANSSSHGKGKKSHGARSGCHLLALKLRMALLWLIPIYIERRRVAFVGLIGVAASIYVDLPSSVVVFGDPDLLT